MMKPKEVSPNSQPQHFTKPVPRILNTTEAAAESLRADFTGPPTIIKTTTDILHYIFRVPIPRPRVKQIYNLTVT